MDLLCSLIQRVLKLQRFDKVSVPNHATILNANILVLLQDAVDNIFAFRKVVRVAVNGRILLHGNLELTPQIGSWNWALAVAHLVQAGDCSFASIGWNLHWWAVGLYKLCCRICGLTTEHD